MLVFDIAGQDFEDLIDVLNRAQAMRLLDEIQMQAVRSGLNTMTMDEIDAEIATHRRNPPTSERKRASHQRCAVPLRNKKRK